MSSIKRRTTSMMDKEDTSISLPLHPDVESVMTLCMKEVKEGKDRGETLSLGKY